MRKAHPRHALLRVRAPPCRRRSPDPCSPPTRLNGRSLRTDAKLRSSAPKNTNRNTSLPHRHRRVPAAQRVGDVFVDLGRIARQPVELGAAVGHLLAPGLEGQLRAACATACRSPAGSAPRRGSPAPTRPSRPAEKLAFQIAAACTRAECRSTKFSAMKPPIEWPKTMTGRPGCSLAMRSWMAATSAITFDAAVGLAEDAAAAHRARWSRHGRDGRARRRESRAPP